MSDPFGYRTVLRINRPFDTPVGVRVQRVQKVVAASRQLKKGFSGLTGLSARGFLSLTALGAEGCGIAHGATTWQGSGGFRRFKGFRGWWYRPAGDEYEVSVTEFTFVYQVLQNEELKPLPWEGACRRQATEEQRGLDDRSQKSDVRMRYGLPSRPHRHSDPGRRILVSTDIDSD